jgi:hypothetical protein
MLVFLFQFGRLMDWVTRILTLRPVRSVVDDTSSFEDCKVQHKVCAVRKPKPPSYLTSCDHAIPLFLMNLGPLDEAQVLRKSQFD